MRKKIIWIALLCLPVAVTGAAYFVLQYCRADKGPEEADMYYKPNNNNRRISASQARAWMERYPQAVILDVRSETEFAAGRIRGATLLPLDEIKEKAETLLPDKNALILIYCRSGIRSQEALEKLIDMGYANVYDFGGILDWPYGRE